MMFDETYIFLIPNNFHSKIYITFSLNESLGYEQLRIINVLG